MPTDLETVVSKFDERFNEFESLALTKVPRIPPESSGRRVAAGMNPLSDEIIEYAAVWSGFEDSNRGFVVGVDLRLPAGPCILYSGLLERPPGGAGQQQLESYFDKLRQDNQLHMSPLSEIPGVDDEPDFDDKEAVQQVVNDGILLALNRDTTKEAQKQIDKQVEEKIQQGSDIKGSIDVFVKTKNYTVLVEITGEVKINKSKVIKDVLGVLSCKKTTKGKSVRVKGKIIVLVDCGGTIVSVTIKADVSLDIAEEIRTVAQGLMGKK
ncbi:MAG: hypothetical protein NPIRA05_17800 [Nitrospirales bacterium]|nr:MAG: hypothetical protein NPIRA05_17800 [Nitrospirales bacterium]